MYREDVKELQWGLNSQIQWVWYYYYFYMSTAAVGHVYFDVFSLKGVRKQSEWISTWRKERNSDDKSWACFNTSLHTPMTNIQPVPTNREEHNIWIDDDTFSDSELTCFSTAQRHWPFYCVNIVALSGSLFRTD